MESENENGYCAKLPAHVLEEIVRSGGLKKIKKISLKSSRMSMKEVIDKIIEFYNSKGLKDIRLRYAKDIHGRTLYDTIDVYATPNPHLN